MRWSAKLVSVRIGTSRCDQGRLICNGAPRLLILGPLKDWQKLRRWKRFTSFYFNFGFHCLSWDCLGPLGGLWEPLIPRGPLGCSLLSLCDETALVAAVTREWQWALTTAMLVRRWPQSTIIADIKSYFSRKTATLHRKMRYQLKKDDLRNITGTIRHRAVLGDFIFPMLNIFSKWLWYDALSSISRSDNKVVDAPCCCLRRIHSRVEQDRLLLFFILAIAKTTLAAAWRTASLDAMTENGKHKSIEISWVIRLEIFHVQCTHYCKLM